MALQNGGQMVEYLVLQVPGRLFVLLRVKQFMIFGGFFRTAIYGALAGLLYLPFSLLLTILMPPNAGMLHTLVMFGYPLACAMIGAGSLIRIHSDSKLSERACALVGAFSLILFLAINYLVPRAIGQIVPLAFILSLLPLCTFYTIAGYLFQGQLSAGNGAESPSQHWLCYYAAFGIAVFFSDFMLKGVGPGGIIVSVAAGMALAGAWIPSLLVPGISCFLALTSLLSIDEKLERARELTSYFPHVRETSDGPSEGFSFLGWDRRGQLRIVPQQQTNGDPAEQRFGGYYNLVPHFSFGTFENHDEADRRNQSPITAIYSQFRAQDSIVIVGIGGGKYLTKIPAEARGPNLIAVERSESLVDFIRAHSVDIYARAFERVSIYPRDGRYVLEQLSAPADYIVFEGTGDQGRELTIPMATPYNLSTEEALSIYLRRLKDDGVLVMNLNLFGGKQKFRNHLVAAVEHALTKLNYPFRVFHRDNHEYLLISSKDEARLSFLSGRIRQQASETLTESSVATQALCATRAHTDDRPFVAWQCKGKRIKKMLKIFSGLLLLFCLALPVIYGRLAPSRNKLSPRYVFLLFGCGYTMLFVSTVFQLRTFFGEETLTFLRVVLYFALGTLLSAALLNQAKLRLSPGKMAAILATLTVLYWCWAARAPFENPSWMYREFFMGTALLVISAVLNLVFPWLLAASNKVDSSPAAFFDYVGSFAAYPLMVLLLFPWGIRVYYYCGLLLCILAIGIHGICKRASIAPKSSSL